MNLRVKCIGIKLNKKYFEWFSLVEDPVIFDGEPSNPPILGP